ncbi:hypothetical protein [Piscirickettsia salmonis]|uniref:hypothetical protein n=1 Tax=Piscirickettsia salmonis TaxID=1238 RepID=UPI001E4AAD97|nr:hypothetical protein [Piscirickettsia salmonis]QGP28948.1 hypothetical protein Psal160_01310 [Piscirickettsia salmonis]
MIVSKTRQKNWLELEHVADLLEWVSQEQVMALSGLDFSVLVFILKRRPGYPPIYM